jgi:hypothetical protein
VCLSGCGVVVFSGRIAQAQQYSRQVVCPINCGAAGSECVFEAAVESFHQTIGLRMVGCCVGMLDIQQVAQGGLQGGGEISAEVPFDD